MISSFLLYCLLTAPPVFTAIPPMQAAESRDLAKTWGMHRIAVIQAKHGDVQGAKRTLSQIGDEGEKRPADVTAVWFCDGQPIYDHPPAQSVRSLPYASPSFDRSPAVHRAPAKAPPGLPANYLSPDPRRGAVVEWIDERDSRGVRVVSRRYADGSVVIETPKSR